MNLLMFLSDRCDLACDYCFLSLNEGKPVVLSEEDAALAVDSHLRRAGARAQFTILGGEPLLHPVLALSIARRARAAGAKVTVVTNGTHASPETVSALLSLGAEVSVSVDGPAARHDKHRRLAGGGGSHARVAKALARLDASALRANLVIAEDTVGSFLSAVEWLRERGLTRLSFHADVARPWSAKGLKALEAALEGFSRYARRLGPALTLWHLDSYRAPVAGPGEDDELVLGADARYYVSDAFLALPYGKGLAGAIGDVRSGPDVAKRDGLLARADAGIRAALKGPVYTWPRETWMLAELRGGSPAAAVEAFRKADSALGAALSALARGGDGPNYALRPRDPRQDLQYGETLILVEDPAPYRKERLTAARARREHPGDATVWTRSGAIEACLARPETAIRFLDRALALNSASAWAYAWRGVARATLSRRRRREDGLTDALADLDRALQLGAPDAFVRPWAAELRHDLDDREGALVDLARVPADDPSALWARVERGEILCECGRLDEAMTGFTALVEEHPREAWAWALRGRTLATSGRAAEGLHDLDRAAKLAPKSAAVRAWRSEALRRLGRYKDARAELDRAVKLDPRYTLAWVWRGRLKLLAGKPADAFKDLDRAVRLDPRYRLGLAWRGEALFKLGKVKAAKKDFDAISPMDPRRFWNAPAPEGVVPDAAARERAYFQDTGARA